MAELSIEVEVKTETVRFYGGVNIDGVPFGDIVPEELFRPGVISWAKLECSGVLADLEGEYLVDLVADEDDLQRHIELSSHRGRRIISIMECEVAYGTRIDAIAGPVHFTLLCVPRRELREFEARC